MTTIAAKKNLEAIYRIVDRIYTPFEGCKTPNVADEIEFLICCNQPSAKIDEIVEKGLGCYEEYWDIQFYLRQVLAEVKAKGSRSGNWASKIMPFHKLEDHWPTT